MSLPRWSNTILCSILIFLQIDDLLSEIAKLVCCYVSNVLVGNYFFKTVIRFVIIFVKLFNIQGSYDAIQW